jgi:hypothetical protein
MQGSKFWPHTLWYQTEHFIHCTLVCTGPKDLMAWKLEAHGLAWRDQTPRKVIFMWWAYQHIRMAKTQMTPDCNTCCWVPAVAALQQLLKHRSTNTASTFAAGTGLLRVETLDWNDIGVCIIDSVTCQWDNLFCNVAYFRGRLSRQPQNDITVIPCVEHMSWRGSNLSLHTRSRVHLHTQKLGSSLWTRCCRNLCPESHNKAYSLSNSSMSLP